MYLLLIMIKTLHFLGTLDSCYCLGTLASQHLKNTLFNLGLKTQGVTSPPPYFGTALSAYTNVNQNSKIYSKFCKYSSCMASSCSQVASPLNFYHLYNLIPEHFEFSIQYLHWLDLKVSLCLYLKNMSINNMVRIMYIFI
jgi:hypothetical protein